MKNLILLSTFLCGISTFVCYAAPDKSFEAATINDEYSTKTAVNGKTTKYIIDDADLELCKKNDENLGECLKNIFNEVVQRLSVGNKDLDIPQFEPFSLNRTTLDIESPLINGRITIRNTKIYNLSNSKLDKLEIKINDNKFKMKSFSKNARVQLTGNYKAEFKVNNAIIKPKGKFNVTLLDMNIESRFEGDFYEKDGHKFMRLTRFNSVPMIGDLIVDATGIFDEPELNEVALEVIKHYWRDVLKVVVPQTRQFWEPLTIRIINEFMARAPFDYFDKKQ